MAVQNAFNHIIISDVDGKIIYANNAVERITGYSTKEIIGKTPRLWGGLMG
jgi:PAS domain S-box-containing protein